MAKPEQKPLVWIGSSLDDLKAFPREVQHTMGFALRVAQNGGKHPDAKPLKGFGGAGVLEVIDDFDGNTFRSVYTVQFQGTIYVLHAFQKKSARGIATAKKDLNLIKQRLRAAEQRHNASGSRTRGGE